MTELFISGPIAGRTPRGGRPAPRNVERELPEQPSRFYAWQNEAACRGRSGLFFAPEYERLKAKAEREEAAKRVCASCPVMARCREHALATPESAGTWGGLTEAEREDLIRPGGRAKS